MSVYTKLMAARMKLHGQAIKKSGRNEFAKYNYMELADFLIPTQTIFSELGLCGVVSFTADVASLTIVDTDDGSQIVLTSPMGSAALKGCHEVQNIGAVETYQRRYLWVTAMEIVEHDALDSSEPVKPQPAKARTGVAQDVLKDSPALKPEQIAALQALSSVVMTEFEAYGPQAAFERIDEQGLDDIEKIYLSTQLPSNVRNPITAYSRSLHQQKATA